MDNTLAICQAQIRLLNSRLINSEIGLDDYRNHVETLLCGMGWQKRIQFDELIFS